MDVTNFQLVFVPLFLWSKSTTLPDQVDITLAWKESLVP